MPVMSAGQSRAVGIRLLMTTRTIQSGYALAFWTTNDVGEMSVAIIALLRVIRRRMAVDAARMR